MVQVRAGKSHHLNNEWWRMSAALLCKRDFAFDRIGSTHLSSLVGSPTTDTLIKRYCKMFKKYPCLVWCWILNLTVKIGMAENDRKQQARKPAIPDLLLPDLQGRWLFSLHHLASPWSGGEIQCNICSRSRESKVPDKIKSYFVRFYLDGDGLWLGSLEMLLHLQA